MTVQIQISWLLQKPTDLDLHYLQRQGISGCGRTRVNNEISTVFNLVIVAHYSHKYVIFPSCFIFILQNAGTVNSFFFMTVLSYDKERNGFLNCDEISLVGLLNVFSRCIFSLKQCRREKKKHSCTPDKDILDFTLG